MLDNLKSDSQTDHKAGLREQILAGIGRVLGFPKRQKNMPERQKSEHELMRIGVMSIPQTLPDPTGKSFEWYITRFGRNTGNYMFTQAAYRQLRGTAKNIGFSYVPEAVNRDYDHLVIPAANWLNAKSDFTGLAELIEQTEIPVTVIGLGVQASTQDLSQVVVTDGGIRLARALSAKSPYLSVRGDFTRDWLNSIGIQNVVTTGCPSIYMRLAEQQKCDADGPLAMQSTRYTLPPRFSDSSSVNREIFRLAGKLDAHMVYQSEFLEMGQLVFGTDAGDPKGAQYLAALYGLNSHEEAMAYLQRRGHLFHDLQEWSSFLQGTAGVLGTRLHGSIIALNSGVPAVLIPHNSRTSEVVNFAKIPTVSGEQLRDLTEADVRAMLRDADIGTYLEARKRNGQVYRQFLRDAGLPYREENML